MGDQPPHHAVRSAAHRRPRPRRLHDGRARRGRRGLAAHPVQLLPEQDSTPCSASIPEMPPTAARDVPRRRPARQPRRRPRRAGPDALEAKEPDRESIALGRRVLTANPRLLAAAHERFESVTEEFADARRSSARAPASTRPGPGCCSACCSPSSTRRSIELVEDDRRPHPRRALRRAARLRPLPVRLNLHHLHPPQEARTPPWPPCSTDSARPPTGAGRSSSPAGWCC